MKIKRVLFFLTLPLFVTGCTIKTVSSTRSFGGLFGTSSSEQVFVHDHDHDHEVDTNSKSGSSSNSGSSSDDKDSSICTYCNGTGHYGDWYGICRNCGARVSMGRTCPNCKVSVIDWQRDDCPYCNGTGKKRG